MATVYLIYRTFQDDYGWHALMAIPIVWAAFVYQFGLVLLLLAVYIVCFAQHVRSLWEPPLQITYGVVVICLVFWLPVLAAHPEIPLGHKAVAMFGFPHFAKYFLYWFLKGWPLMTVVFLLGSMLLLLRFVSDRRDSVSLFVLGAIFVPALFASFFRAWAEARYTFHLYPLMVMVVAALALKAASHFFQRFSAKGRGRWYFIAPAVVLGVFLLSQDANPLAAWHIGNRTYQSSKDPIRSVLNWTFFARYHQDHMNPSLYVRERLAPGDKVVVLEGLFYELAIYHFYTGRVDYVIGCPNHTQDFGRLKNGKVIHYITGSEILDSLSEAKNVIEEGTGAIWFLGDLKTSQFFCSEPMTDYLRSLIHDPDYVGLDGQTFAVRVR
jgi:hypothetical protein